MIGEAIFHLLFGFIFFAGRNIVRMNFNWDTLAPGLVAYLVFVFLLHRAMRRLCRDHARAWSFRSSFVVALLLPAIFGITFLVPGVILHIQELAKVL